MPFLIENILTTVIWLIALGGAGLAIFVIVAVQRRVRRGQFFRGLDAARIRAQHQLQKLHENPEKLKEVIPELKKFKNDAEWQAMGDVFLDRPARGVNFELVRKVAIELGWIKEWIEVLRCRRRRKEGRLDQMLKEMGDTYQPPTGLRRLQTLLKTNFMERCMAAKRLSQVPTPEGMIALLAGTDDPDGEVREVCVRKLGQLADPATLPVLIEELIQVLEGKSPLSVRTLKSALIMFALDEMDAFRGALVHPNRRIRFFATDIIREVTQRQAQKEQLGKNDFSPEVYRLFTETLWKDEWADVRARAAPVIVHFNDDTSAGILGQLLEDDTWFVRLHTARSITSRFYLSLVPALAKRLTDAHWLVREAAVHSLGQMGDVGINESFRAFLNTRDTYAAEQIAETFQRDGTLVNMLSSLTQISSEQEYARARAVARRMIQLGKTTLLQSYLVVPSPRSLKLMLIEELSGSISASYLQVLQACSEIDDDPDVRTAATGVFQSASSLLLRQQKN